MGGWSGPLRCETAGQRSSQVATGQRSSINGIPVTLLQKDWNRSVNRGWYITNKVKCFSHSCQSYFRQIHYEVQYKSVRNLNLAVQLQTSIPNNIIQPLIHEDSIRRTLKVRKISDNFQFYIRHKTLHHKVQKHETYWRPVLNCGNSM